METGTQSMQTLEKNIHTDACKQHRRSRKTNIKTGHIYNYSLFQKQNKAYRYK